MRGTGSLKCRLSGEWSETPSTNVGTSLARDCEGLQMRMVQHPGFAECPTFGNWRLVMQLARSGFTGRSKGMWDQQENTQPRSNLFLQNHHGFLRGGMLFPQQTSYVAKRHCLRWMRHFPERPFTVTNSEAGIGQYELLLCHGLLRSMFRMARDFERLRLTAEQRSGLPESGDGPKKAQ